MLGADNSIKIFFQKFNKHFLYHIVFYYIRIVCLKMNIRS